MIPRIERGELDLALVSRQIAAVEGGLAVAVLTQCSASPHLEILGSKHRLGPLEPMAVSIFRSRASRVSEALDKLLIRTLRISEAS